MIQYPKIWNVPVFNQDFTGREKQLEEILNILQREKNRSVKITICGLPGVGKTQLVKRFAYLYKEKYRLIWWVNAETNLESDYLKLAEELNILIDNRQFKDIWKDISKFFKNYMDGWLIIFDNVDKPEDILSYLPDQHTDASGHILITSRDDIGWSQSYYLKPFTLIESKSYLLKITGQKDDIGAIRVAERLGHLPLALSYATGYMRSQHKTYDEYLKLYSEINNNIIEQQDLNKIAAYVDYYKQTVRGSFLLLFNKIRNKSSSALLELLFFCSFLHAEAIPKFLLERFLNDRKIDFDEAYLPLSNILQRDKVLVENGDGLFTYQNSYSLHRLIQEFINEQIIFSKKLKYLDNYLDVICICFQPEIKHKANWQNATMLISHVEAILNWADFYKIVNNKVKLLIINAFNFCLTKDMLEMVGKNFDRLKKYISQLKSSDFDFHLYAKFLINWVHYYKAIRAEPREYGEIIYKIDEFINEDHLSVLNDSILMFDLKYQLSCALLEKCLTEYSMNALVEIRRAKQILESLLEELIQLADPIREIDCLCRLGNLYQITQEYDRALEYLYQAHQVHKNSGYIYPNMGYTYNLIGGIYREKDYTKRDLEKSKKYFLASLAEVEYFSELSKTNRYKSWAHYWLAYIFSEQKNEEQTQFHYKKFVENVNVLFKKWPPSYEIYRKNLEEYIKSQPKMQNIIFDENCDLTTLSSLNDNADLIRLLIIDSDKDAAQYLKKGLSENGYVVDIEYNGENGLYRALHFNYALIILDLNIPRIEGSIVIKNIRNANKFLPIIITTKIISLEEKIKALEIGADDYLTKPLNFSELLIKVRSLLRRSLNSYRLPILKIADLEINIKEHLAARNGVNLNLTNKEFLLLCLLAKHKNELLSRTFITEQIWDMNFDSDTNIVDVTIRRLRKKLDDSFTKKLIHAVRSIGYILKEE